jgi:hypothetical protein
MISKPFMFLCYRVSFSLCPCLAFTCVLFWFPYFQLIYEVNVLCYKNMCTLFIELCPFYIISSLVGISCFSWIFARKWPYILQGPQLGILCRFLSLFAWIIVVSPVLMLIMWGSWLIVILHRDIIGLAVIMAGTALLLAFYSIMLWWRTQWQSSSMCLCTLFIF